MGTLIRLELQATLKRFLPAAHERYPVEPGLCVRDLLAQLGIAEYEVNIVFINGVPENLDSTIEGGEKVVLYPPLGGG
jgi:molybdopterin synthase sulfur carrier subunit